MYDLFLSPLVMASALRLMTPVLFAAMGGSFGHKAKVLCLGLESFMAFAAFFAMYGSYTFESAYAGLLFGVLSAMIASCIFAVFVLIFKSTPVIVGIALNLAAWGGTTYLLSMIFKTRGVFIDPQIKSFGSIDIPLINGYSVYRKFHQRTEYSGLSDLVFMIIAIFIMFKIPFGLRLRGVGIKKIAAQTVGVNATKYQFIAILIGGMLCGFGGSFLTIGGSSMFTENISAGKGFLALAAIMVGDGHPLKTALACFVFGYTEAISVSLQSVGLPSQVVISVPYLITVLVMFVSAVVEKCKLKMAKAR